MTKEHLIAKAELFVHDICILKSGDLTQLELEFVLQEATKLINHLKTKLQEE